MIDSNRSATDELVLSKEVGEGAEVLLGVPPAVLDVRRVLPRAHLHLYIDDRCNYYKQDDNLDNNNANRYCCKLTSASE